MDVHATLLDLFGVTARQRTHGRSLAPLLRGERMPAESVFLEWSPNGRRLATSDEHGKVKELTVFLRPAKALAAIGEGEDKFIHAALARPDSP